MLTTDKEQIMKLAKKIAWDTANEEIPEEDELYTREVDALRLLGHDDIFELIAVRLSFMDTYEGGKQNELSYHGICRGLRGVTSLSSMSLRYQMTDGSRKQDSTLRVGSGTLTALHQGIQLRRFSGRLTDQQSLKRSSQAASLSLMRMDA